MTGTRCRGCWVSVFALLAGCAGARQAPPPQSAAIEPAPVATPEPEATDDLSPVPAPGDLVVVGRWQAPVTTVDTVLGWTNLPLDWRVFADQALPRTSSGPAREVVALDAPVDLVVALPRPGEPPEPRMAVSFGVTSIDAALELATALGEEVEAVGRRQYRIEDGDVTCMLGPAAGKAPARVVCGAGFADVDALMPYMTRSLPLETIGKDDLHVELRVEPIRRVYGPTLRQGGELGLPFLLRELSLDDPVLDRAVADAARGLIAEGVALVDDVDRVTLTLDVDDGGGFAQSELVVDFRGTKSWTATTLADAAARAVPAPDLFWALPKDAAAARFGAPGNPERWQEIRRTTVGLLDAALRRAQAPETLRTQLRKLVETTYTKSTVSVVVQGANPGTGGFDTAGGVSALEDHLLATIAQQLGWQVHGCEIAAKELTDNLDAWARAYNDPAAKRLLATKVLDTDPKNLPTLLSLPAGAGFPAGSRRYELKLTVAGHGGTAKETQSLHLVVVPDGKRTWVGFGADLAVLRQQVARVTRPGTETLRDRAGLEALRDGRYVSAGFGTLRSSYEGLLQQYLGMSAADREATFAVLPEHGETPMVSTLRVTGESAPRLEWSARIPQAVVRDLAAAVPSIMASSVFTRGIDAVP